MTGSFRHRAIVISIYILAVVAFAAGVWWYGYRTALDELARRGRSDLALAADSLRSDLKSDRELAVLMAGHPDVSQALRGASGALVPLLREVADKTGSRDIFLVDQSGQLLASTDTRTAQRHAGQPYFERAMDGALGVSHRVSQVDGQRTFVFAAPVFSPFGPVLGVLVVVSDVQEIEAAWQGDRPAVYFTDRRGVVFVSNRSELVFRTRLDDLAAIAASGDYPADRIRPFPPYSTARFAGRDVWRVDGGRYLPGLALHLTLDMPVIEMTGEILLDVGPAQQLATLQAVMAAAVCLAFGALLFLATERRRTLTGANQRLEARVADRTAALSQLNTDLRHEVEERIAAEAQLKQAQADLVQAGKLSALGQMSAGISHELNQPLMAIRSFAENAQGYLGRGKPEVAAKNLGRISEMAHRMDRIIRNLRAFSRQESEPIHDVDIVAVIDAAAEMVEAKAHQADVVVRWKAQRPIWVRGGEVRLQQVIVNLLSNAIDAMAGTDTRVVTVTVTSDGPRVMICVRDTGPGIHAPEKIFDPFYSTKSVGAGMGLGLSISYGLVQSFGGMIRGRNAPEGGAVFTVELDAAHSEGRDT